MIKMKKLYKKEALKIKSCFCFRRYVFLYNSFDSNMMALEMLEKESNAQKDVLAAFTESPDLYLTNTALLHCKLCLQHLHTIII